MPVPVPSGESTCRACDAPVSPDDVACEHCGEPVASRTFDRLAAAGAVLGAATTGVAVALGATVSAHVQDAVRNGIVWIYVLVAAWAVYVRWAHPQRDLGAQLLAVLGRSTVRLVVVMLLATLAYAVTRVQFREGPYGAWARVRLFLDLALLAGTMLVAIRDQGRAFFDPRIDHAHPVRAPGERVPVWLYVHIPLEMEAVERVQRFEEPLSAALASAGVEGVVSGGGTDLVDGMIVRVGFGLDVWELEAALPVVREALRTAGAPGETEINTAEQTYVLSEM